MTSYEEYHPYGSTAWWMFDSSRGVSKTRYKYTGMERDEETGLQVHGVRYYAPWLGRWCSGDPIALKGGINRYCFCSSSPTCRMDSSGRDPTVPWVLLGLWAAGAFDDFDYLIEGTAGGPGDEKWVKPSYVADTSEGPYVKAEGPHTDKEPIDPDAMRYMAIGGGALSQAYATAVQSKGGSGAEVAAGANLGLAYTGAAGSASAAYAGALEPADEPESASLEGVGSDPGPTRGAGRELTTGIGKAYARNPLQHVKQSATRSCGGAAGQMAAESAGGTTDEATLMASEFSTKEFRVGDQVIGA